MKTSLEERGENAADTGGGQKGKISFSVDSLLSVKNDVPNDTASIDAESTDAAPESDESDVDIEDVESNDDHDRENTNESEEMEARGGVVVPQPLLPRLYQGHPPPAWPFGAFPWMAHNPMFRGGSPNSKYIFFRFLLSFFY